MPRNIYKQIANAESSPPLSEIASAKRVSVFLFFFIYICCQETVDSRIRNQKSGIREPFYFIRIEEQVNQKKSFYINRLRIPI